MIVEILTFLAMEATLLGALILYAFYKANWSKDQFMKNWVRAEGGKTSLLKGLSVILLVPILFGALLHSCNVEAEEIKWINGASVFVGIDNTSSPSPFCEEIGINDRLTSNIGFVQNIATTNEFNVGTKYTHHSCALNPDDNAYDSIGIVLEWKLY